MKGVQAYDCVLAQTLESFLHSDQNYSLASYICSCPISDFFRGGANLQKGGVRGSKKQAARFLSIKEVHGSRSWQMAPKGVGTDFAIEVHTAKCSSLFWGCRSDVALRHVGLRHQADSA